MANANELMYKAAAVKTVSKTEQAKNWKYQKTSNVAGKNPLLK